MAGSREAIEAFVDATPGLTDLGYIPGNTYAADVQDNPSVFPFMVIRWGDEQAGLSDVRRRPFDIWIYDEEGDYRRCSKITQLLRQRFKQWVPTKVDDGWLTQVSGGLVGGDLADDAFKAVVLAQSFVAVGSGV